MAQKFGGQFSPDGTGPTAPKTSPLSGKQPAKGRTRANLLFLVALPILFTSIGDGARDMAVAIGAFALMALGAWLTREGIDAQNAYEARTIARRPAIPRKIFGAIALGLGVGVATLDTSLMDGVLYGIIAVILHLASFGLDPMRDKALEGVDTFQTDRVARAVDEAERHLRAMTDAIATAGDRTMIARVEQFQATARSFFRTVENDPRDLTTARRYLGVYLLGAKDATIKFSKLYAQGRDPSVKADYTSLLDDLEANFTAKNQALLSDNRTDLDIEIDVLRDRLQREGIRLNEGE
ncbi:5-bromo-4-chloroindolyl phosphate hydrolysis protein [Litoreibacter halocynthiae]|uniref:5-bromo-4-chloroindolyl phosphate hydrolysis protein n=1 Tax=Litoreibacter halocynthiae TaxID=1242689 RepID=A0A4R7LQN5_9RHOB|nr:5-bromo-4-chloroindolyl phosphate hydrolysis family protein [Litoreibacter halocynthiae]TDT77102.1 5-bromo-4-chloroindolyl phosphate hydrolysis protein [Litoreibacter halocynthiae]